ncbi:MAG TPA: C25 family cysteine peptidase [bacterium]|nr:C25 family cysteine peptidase [bacterium]
MRLGRTLILAGLALGLAQSSGWAQWSAPEVVRQTSDQLVFRVHLATYSLERLDLAGHTYTQVIAPGLVPFARAGEPNVPVLPVMIAVPAEGRARLLSVELAEETSLDGIRVVPVEGIRAVGSDQGKFADYTYAEKDSIYGATEVFPREAAWLADPGRLRHQDVVKVMVAPFRYDPSRNRLLVTRAITVTVKFEGRAPGLAPQSFGTALPVEDAWEGVYRNALVNYEQGRRWRAVKLAALGAPREAVEVTNDRVKITITKTGMHTLTFDALHDLGFPGDIPLAQVFMYQDSFHDGAPDTLFSNEIGVEELDKDGDGFFSSGDTLRFYARDFYDQYGRQGNEDAYFNKNIYWLSWGAGDHRRIGLRSGWREAVAPAKPTHFSDFIHVEADSFFVVFPPRADCDLYAWTSRRRITPFDLPGIDASLGSTLTVNFISYFNEARSGSSAITLYMTGCSSVQTEVGTVSAAVPSVKKASFDLAPGLLCETGNRFRFESSLLGQSDTPGNMLDWFEVLYQHKYQAAGDVLSFTNGGVTGEVEFEVGGFSASGIRLFDVTDPARPVEVYLPPAQIGSGYQLTFRDSLDSDHAYIAVGPAGYLPVGSADLALKEPPRLRQANADYLVITHPDFLSEANRLAEFRQEQSYHTLVATTDEVYDDFGNGMKSDIAVRRFIRQGFYSGGAQFVLLVGDANVDHRGVLVVPQPGYPMSQPRSGIDYVPSHDIVRDDGETPNKESRAVDNWYAIVETDDRYPDVYLGRLPVGSVAEARGVVDKILAFEQASGPDPWKKRLVLAADDDYKYDLLPSGDIGPDCWNAADPNFAMACDSVAAVAANSAVVAPDTVKYYLSRCTKDDQPDKRCQSTTCCTTVYTTQLFTRAHCTPDFVALMNAGAMMVNYQGHANRAQLTHENLILDYQSYTDVRGLRNASKPFIFAGYSCWISDFDYRAEPDFGDAIGEKFILNSNGGACACFASACSEQIYANRVFNPFVARAMFSSLTPRDVQGQLLPARILLGEAMLTALVRFGDPDYALRYILFGDPSMMIDMGPPRVAVAVNGTSVDSNYVFEGAVFDTLDVVADVRDEEAITRTGVDLVAGSAVSAVSSDSVLTEPLVDLNLKRARAYRVTYHHAPLLGDYAVRVEGEDYSGKTSYFDVRLRTGTARFLREETELAPGETLEVGETLRLELARPFAFTANDVEATIDGVPAAELGRYSVVMKDTQGKQWEASLLPGLTAGEHDVVVSVAGFKARRHFVYSPVRVDVLADGRNLFESDFVAADASLEMIVRAVGDVSADDIQVALDGAPRTVVFQPNEAKTEWRGGFDLAGMGLTPGTHALAVTVKGLVTTRDFRISEGLSLLDVSVFPNPFSGATYFFYTLSEEAREAHLAIYTVSGRKILDADVGAFPGYNQYKWDGRDSRGDRVANGTYIFKLVVTGAARREAVGRVIKLD